jgi:hypothetical protein
MRSIPKLRVMLVASTSQSAWVGPLRRQVAAVSLSSSSRTVAGRSLVSRPARTISPFDSRLTTFAPRIAVLPLPTPRAFNGTVRYSTSAVLRAQSNTAQLKPATSEMNEQDQSESDPDQPPKKATIRERLRFLSRRYGWWALGVYLLASLVDFSLTFLAIHMLGADHIRDLENRFRRYIGMGKRELEDHEVAAWPVPIAVGGSSQGENSTVANNAEAARVAAQRVKKQEDIGLSTGGKPSSSSSSSSSGTLWTEALLAYTIHKTLLLPFRVGVTAAVTPSFVKYMVRLGWAKNNDAVKQAAHKVKMARDAAKAKAASKV